MRITTEQRREQLVEAAIVLLMRDGVERVSVRAIAAEAGASLAAVHVCFTDKDELMRGAMEGFLKRLTIPASGRPALKRGIRATGIKIMDGFWKMTSADTNFAVAQFEVGMWSLRNSKHKDLIEQIYVSYEEQIADILDKARALSGDIPAMPVPVIARGLVAVMDGCSLQYLANPTNPAARSLCDELLDALFDKAGV